MIGAREIALLKQGAGIVNISRAPVMDYDALAAALHAEHLSGAIIDVFHQEPLPPDAPWWHTPNMVVVPHVSSDTPAGYVQKLLKIFPANIANRLEGRPIENAVNPQLGY